MTIVTQIDEKVLLLQLKQGDERAFEILYNNYKSRLAGNLFKLLKSEDLVKEILQELFFKVWTIRAQIDPDKSFKSYLFRIGENLVNDYFRKTAKDKRLLVRMMATTSELYSHIEEEIFRKENAQIFQQAVDLMPPVRKLVYTLCKIEGKSYREVEKIMGINGKTISSHMLKANIFLRDHFRSSTTAIVVVILGYLFGNF